MSEERSGPESTGEPAPIRMEHGLPWVLGLSAAVLVGVWLARPVFGVLVLSLGTAWLLDPVVDQWEARGRSREIGILLIFWSFLAIVAAVLIGLAPMLVQEVRDGAAQLQIYWETAPDRLGPWVLRLEEWLGTPIDRSSRSELLAPGASGSWVATLFSVSMKGGVGLFLWFMNLLMFPVFSYYLLRDWDRIWAWLDGLVPPRNQQHARGLARRVDSKLGGFFWGQLVVAGVLSLLYTGGLWAVGVDAALPLGLLAGVVSLVPYLGLVVGCGASVAACVLQHGVDWHVGATVGVFLVAQTVETLLITPRVMGQRVGLHPLMVMVVIIAGGSAGGVLGMLIAVPVAAIGQVVVADFVRAYRASDFFRAAG